MKSRISRGACFVLSMCCLQAQGLGTQSLAAQSLATQNIAAQNVATQTATSQNAASQSLESTAIRSPSVKAPHFSKGTLKVEDIAYDWTTPEELASTVKEVGSRVQRGTASTAPVDIEAGVSKGLKKLSKEMQAIDTVEQVDVLFDRLEREYDRLEPDAKLAAAQVLMIKPFKGLVYRLSLLASKMTIPQSELLSFITRQAATIRVYFPPREAAVFFRYVTEPYDGVVPFDELEDFQGFISDTVYQAAALSASRIKRIKITTPIVWDRSLLSGVSGEIGSTGNGGSITGTPSDEKLAQRDRFILIGPGEKAALLAAKNMGMHHMTLFRSYAVLRLQDFTKETGLLYGVDGFSFSHDAGVMLESVAGRDRTEMLKEPRFANTFVRYHDGAHWMSRALKHFEEAVYHERIAHRSFQTRPPTDSLLAHPAFLVDPDVGSDDRLALLDAIVKGPTLVKSRATGESVRVDIRSYYLSPPQDLKTLLPTSHDNSKPVLPKTVLIAKDKSPSKVTYHNYLRGRAVSWDKDAYKKLLPDLSSGEDVKRAARIIKQSWASPILVGPLSSFTL